MEFSFAATSVLARQIENGAHADVFFSADQEWMDYLDQRGLVQKATRRNLLGNRLALVAPASSTVQLQIKAGFPLLAALNGGRLATGDPDSVPVGRYARSALTSLGVWNDVADHLVRADNVRTALAFVARGEVPLGIVYETDARIDKQVRIVDLFPAGFAPPHQLSDCVDNRRPCRRRRVCGISARANGHGGLRSLWIQHSALTLHEGK